MPIAVLLYGVSVNGNFPNGTLVTRPFRIIRWQILHDLQNLVHHRKPLAKRTQPEFFLKFI